MDAESCGRVLPGSPEELRELGNKAARDGKDAKAAQLYTVAIDVLTKSMPRDENGVAKPEDLRKLNQSSEGQLAKLLSNRSMVYLRQRDVEAALEDAKACTDADPAYEKGQLRLLAAMEAFGVDQSEQEAACARAVESCPESSCLSARLNRLRAAKPGTRAQSPQDSRVVASGIELTKQLADDPSDPRHAMAAADLGAALAVGAHGQPKDLCRAERYLRIGVKGGDVAAQRNLGLFLLEQDRPVEAAEELRGAAEAGDEQAAATLQQLLEESEVQAKLARAKLEEMASQGEQQAIEMLQALSVAA